MPGKSKSPQAKTSREIAFNIKHLCLETGELVTRVPAALLKAKLTSDMQPASTTFGTRLDELAMHSDDEILPDYVNPEQVDKAGKLLATLDRIIDGEKLTPDDHLIIHNREVIVRELIETDRAQAERRLNDSVLGAKGLPETEQLIITSDAQSMRLSNKGGPKKAQSSLVGKRAKKIDSTATSNIEGLQKSALVMETTLADLFTQLEKALQREAIGTELA